MLGLWCILAVLLTTSASHLHPAPPVPHNVSESDLLQAFHAVFDPDNAVTSIEVPQMQLVLAQLHKQGILTPNLCHLPSARQALILMQNAKFLIEDDLREKNDWQIIYTEDRFQRSRSFAFVRFAMVECLLLISVAGLSYLIWKQA